MVNTTVFGSAANKIGISASNFGNCVASYSTDASGCSTEPLGTCTAVNGSDAYDQFGTYRTNLWGSYINVDSSWSCSFLGNGPYQPGGTDLGTQYRQAIPWKSLFENSTCSGIQSQAYRFSLSLLGCPRLYQTQFWKVERVPYESSKSPQL